MAYVITEACIGTKDTACVDVCPVDCIHPTRSSDRFEEVDQLFIDPDECIDCGACEPECPVEAIYPEEDVPAQFEPYKEKNADWFRLSADDFEMKWKVPGRKG